MPNNSLISSNIGVNDVIDIRNKSLSARLKKMFSTAVVIRHAGGKQLKLKDTDEIQLATDRNSFKDRFNRVRSTNYNGYTRDFALSYQAARLDLFRDYDTMDMDPILASALDIYADECLTENEMNQMLTIDSKNNNVKAILHNLFYDILHIESNLWSWTRNLTKYGDFFLRLHISPTYGIYNVEPLFAQNVERIENSDPLNKTLIKFQIRPVDTSQAETLENHEMVHFRLHTDSNFLPYGRSMIEPARRVWKQLSLLEDAMLIHRIMRAPEKRIFKIDIGNIPPNEVDNFMEQTISKLKKVPYIDERTGDYNLRFNLQNMVEDFYLPVRGSDSGASIDTLPGMEFTGIDDLEYIKNKMMAALKIPKAFLGYEEGISGKATLAAEDVRFARTIGRIQKHIVEGLNKIAMVHLYAQGYVDEELLDFELGLTNPSTIFEKEKMEIWASKIENAKSMWEMSDSSAPFFSRTFIFEKIFRMNSDDIQRNEQSIVEDAKELWRLKQITEDGNDPAKPFKKVSSEKGGEGDGGGEDAGLPGGDEPDLGGDGGSEPDSGGPESGGGPGGPPSGGGAPAGGGTPPMKEVVSVDEKHGESADDYVRPPQDGIKQASDYPIGEDPLGDKENHRQSRTSGIETRLEHIKPNRMSRILGGNKSVQMLADYLKDNGGNVKKSLIAENVVTKSYLDESNIIE